MVELSIAQFIIIIAVVCTISVFLGTSAGGGLLLRYLKNEKSRSVVREVRDLNDLLDDLAISSEIAEEIRVGLDKACETMTKATGKLNKKNFNEETSEYICDISKTKGKE